MTQCAVTMALDEMKRRHIEPDITVLIALELAKIELEHERVYHHHNPRTKISTRIWGKKNGEKRIYET